MPEASRAHPLAADGVRLHQLHVQPGASKGISSNGSRILWRCKRLLDGSCAVNSRPSERRVHLRATPSAPKYIDHDRNLVAAAFCEAAALGAK